MKTLHSYWGFIVLFILLVAIVNALVGLSAKKTFKDKDLRYSLFGLIVTHIQFLLGLIWYFMSPWFKELREVGMGEAMGNASLRFQAVEHPITMILAIVLITVGWSKHKRKETNEGKFKTIAIFYSLGLFLMLLRIPWNQWFS